MATQQYLQYPVITLNTGSLATEATLSAINSKLAASLVPTAFDYIALTYVPSGNGVGEIQTATYKTGGAAGATVATLTLAYDGSNKLSSVTKT